MLSAPKTVAVPHVHRTAPARGALSDVEEEPAGSTRSERGAITVDQAFDRLVTDHDAARLRAHAW